MAKRKFAAVCYTWGDDTLKAKVSIAISGLEPLACLALFRAASYL